MPKTSIFHKSIPERPLLVSTSSGTISSNTSKTRSRTSRLQYMLRRPISSSGISSRERKSNSIFFMASSPIFICMSMIFRIFFLRRFAILCFTRSNRYYQQDSFTVNCAKLIPFKAHKVKHKMRSKTSKTQNLRR